MNWPDLDKEVQELDLEKENLEKENLKKENLKKEKIKTLKELYVNIYSWQDFFTEIFQDKKIYDTIQELLNQNIIRFPDQDLIFNALKLTSLNDISVVFIGQDPYFNYNQATGLAFSIPKNSLNIPPSLQNIYKNLTKYNHFYKQPTHGNLEFWAHQGCLMLNTALTVELKKPNSHSRVWQQFTNSLITYISTKRKHICFVLWGRPALEKQKLIDTTKHKLIISSHPSGLSCHNTLGVYPAFNNNNHFLKINNYLEKHKKNKIIWQII
jgi:uracil-DNA glycosylase